MIPNGFVRYHAIGIDKQQGRKILHSVALRQQRPLARFHVHFHVDKLRVVLRRHRRIGERLGRHHFARATPSGVRVHKHQFSLRAGFSEYLLPTTLLEYNALSLRAVGANEHKKSH